MDCDDEASKQATNVLRYRLGPQMTTRVTRPDAQKKKRKIGSWLSARSPAESPGRCLSRLAVSLLGTMRFHQLRLGFWLRVCHRSSKKGMHDCLRCNNRIWRRKIRGLSARVALIILTYVQQKEQMWLAVEANRPRSRRSKIGQPRGIEPWFAE